MMMQETIDAVVAVDPDIDREVLEQALPDEGRLNITALVTGFEIDSTVAQSAQLLLVACNEASEAAAELVRRWSTDHPDRPVVALCQSPPDYFVVAMLGFGADDVLQLPESSEKVLFSLEKVLARRRRTDSATGELLAPMICVLGPKGGTGKTVTASNLAVSLAEAGRRTAIIDLDLQFGDVGLVLGLEPERTVYDLATSGGVIDAEKLDAYLSTHESGLRALLAPLRPDQAGAITPELYSVVYNVLRSTYDVIVVDTPPDFTPHVISAIDTSTNLCIVGMLDAVSLKNTRLGLETLELMGYEPDNISVVLNRANTSVGLTRADAEAILERTPDILVPSDRDVPRSVNEGEPVVAGRRRSGVASAFRDLSDIYLDEERNGNGTRLSKAIAAAQTSRRPMWRRLSPLKRGA